MAASSEQGPSRQRGRPPADAPPVAPEAELLALALDAFAELGYEGTSVRELCRRLGVSHNLVHQRFGSKEALWYAAVDHGFGTLAMNLGMALAPHSDPIDGLRAVLVRFLEVSGESPALVQIINQEAVRPGPRLDYIHEQYIGPVNDQLDLVLGHLAETGRLRVVPSGLLYFLIAHGAGAPLSLTGLADKLSDVPDTTEGITAYANQVVDLILRGMTP